MKFYSILIILLLNTELTFSQFDYGLKIGLNFDSAGKIKLASDQLEKQGALNSKTGHHFGIYTEVDFLIFYIRPELQFTKVISQCYITTKKRRVKTAVRNFTRLGTLRRRFDRTPKMNPQDVVRLGRAPSLR